MMATAGVVQAFTAGRVDSLLNAEASGDYRLDYMEEQIAFGWQPDKTLSTGVQFNIRHQHQENNLTDSQNTDIQIQQLFMSETIAAGRYSLGRFSRADLMGFYHLDGIDFSCNKNNWKSNFYGGRPLQIEGGTRIDADSIVGIDVRYSSSSPEKKYGEYISSHLGWQQLNGDGRQNYINFGLSTENKKQHNNIRPLKTIFNGRYLFEESTLESFSGSIQAYSTEQYMGRFSYSRWQPSQLQLSFKERFYEIYARGQQTIMQAELFSPPNKQQKYYLRGRKVWREEGEDGYGASLGIENRHVKDIALWKIQWDFLSLEKDYIHSLYLQINRNISATKRLVLYSALQFNHKSRQEDNQLFALQASMQTMLQSNLFLSLYGRYINNNSQEDEYRFALRLSYRFDDRQWGGK